MHVQGGSYTIAYFLECMSIHSASVVKAGEPVCQGKNNTLMHNPLACTRGIRAQNAAASILNVLMSFFSFIMLSHVQKRYGLVM